MRPEFYHFNYFQLNSRGDVPFKRQFSSYHKLPAGFWPKEIWPEKALLYFEVVYVKSIFYSNPNDIIEWLRSELLTKFFI